MTAIIALEGERQPHPRIPVCFFHTITKTVRSYKKTGKHNGYYSALLLNIGSPPKAVRSDQKVRPRMTKELETPGFRSTNPNRPYVSKES